LFSTMSTSHRHIQLPVVDLSFVGLEMLHNDECSCNPAVRILCLTDNVQERSQPAGGKRVKQPMTFLILMEKFFQLLGHW